MKRRIHIKLPVGQGGGLLLDYLAGRFTYHSKSEWRKHMGDARVRVNDTAVSDDYRLVEGDGVEFIATDVPEPPVCFDVGIVYEDDDVMVINKPPNLPCHPAGRYFKHTLWAWLKTCHGLETPALVNRLDRETSGLLLVAKNSKAEAKCRAQFLKRSVVKRYVALVEGAFPDTLQAKGWMMPDPGSGVHKRRRFERDDSGRRPSVFPPESVAGKEWAETDFRRLRIMRGISAVEAVLHTGRLHQIRATLHSLGYPVVGDKIYGPDPMIFARFCTDAITDEDWRRLRLPRQALHSMELEFSHPSTGLALHFEAPLPADMAGLDAIFIELPVAMPLSGMI
ncbi:MAG: RluA family pseudouridine synthase [bacterium]